MNSSAHLITKSQNHSTFFCRCIRLLDLDVVPTVVDFILDHEHIRVPKTVRGVPRVVLVALVDHPFLVLFIKCKLFETHALTHFDFVSHQL